jgi:hypothetical protein
MSAPVGDYAVVFLAMAWAITWFVDKSASAAIAIVLRTTRRDYRLSIIALRSTRAT